MEINSYLLACIIFHMMVLSQTSCTVNVALRQPPPPPPTNNGIVHPFPKPPMTPGLPGPPPPPPRRPLPLKVNEGRFPSPPPPPRHAPAPHTMVLRRYPPPPQLLLNGWRNITESPYGSMEIAIHVDLWSGFVTPHKHLHVSGLVFDASPSNKNTDELNVRRSLPYHHRHHCPVIPCTISNFVSLSNAHGYSMTLSSQ
uniref:Plastocyanin-like domain-containing protein n=1 Tax=Salix viminalis TaxID=40686 RepID=A0A6N2LLL1_SALVM